MALEILSIAFGGGALVTALITLITFLIKRHDDKSEKKDDMLAEIKKINKRMDKQEKDSVRLQILLLIYNYHTEDTKELMECAEYYFKKKEDGGLEGDWYLSQMFHRFLVSHHIEIPSWFTKGE